MWIENNVVYLIVIFCFLGWIIKIVKNEIVVLWINKEDDDVKEAEPEKERSMGFRPRD